MIIPSELEEIKMLIRHLDGTAAPVGVVSVDATLIDSNGETIGTIKYDDVHCGHAFFPEGDE